MALLTKGGVVSLRPEPVGHKPSGRTWNMNEQTPFGLLFKSNPGTPEYRKFYQFMSNVFGAEAHHIIDLGYIDKMLFKAGFSTGAHGTANYSEARDRILNLLRKKGVDVGNVEENISPLSQAKPKAGRTGLAHKLVHDAYNTIPEASGEYLRTLDEERFADYLVEKSRQRKTLVSAAIDHKYNTLLNEHPELGDLDFKQQREWIRTNKAEFGSLGDETLKEVLEETKSKFIAPVPNQPRGRVAVNPQANKLFRNTNADYFGIVPYLDDAAKTVRRNPLGSAVGAATAIQPDAIKSAIQGDYTEAAKQTAVGAGLGAVAQEGLKRVSSVAMRLLPKGGAMALQTVGKFAGPIGLAYAGVETLNAIVEGVNGEGNGLLETGVAAEAKKEELRKNGYSNHDLRRRYRNGYTK